MLPVLAALGAIWLIGRVFGVAATRRLAAMAALWASVVLGQIAFPESALAQATGGDPRVWLVLGGLVALVLAYRLGLGALRRRGAARVTPTEPAAKGSRLRPAELDRYARHIMLREIGGPGQRRLQAARVLVVGAGGLGSPVCLYLAAAGVGQISVIDDDRVESSNLQRQIIHRDQDIGLPKAQSATAAMRALNPFIEARALVTRLTEDNAEATLAGHDLIIDGTDNFDTRYLVNQSATRLGIPLLSGAIAQWEGQVTLCDPAKGAPCYACIFPERPAPGMVPTCAEAGVAAPLPGVIGSIMAMEAVKYLTGAGETLAGRLMIHDALYAETRTITLRPRAGCAVCGGGSQA
jgi:molybdopterin/thiamine biosynthesis adenylyltransferase